MFGWKKKKEKIIETGSTKTDRTVRERSNVKIRYEYDMELQTKEDEFYHNIVTPWHTCDAKNNNDIAIEAWEYKKRGEEKYKWGWTLDVRTDITRHYLINYCPFCGEKLPMYKEEDK